MANAHVAAHEPKETRLEPGLHRWCACGRSSTQPLCDGPDVASPSCDGSGRDAGITPVPFTINAAKDDWLCMCKQTHTAPYCDGTHAKVPKDATELQSRYSIEPVTPWEPGAPAATTAAAPTEPAPASTTGEMPPPVNTREEPTLEFIHELARNGLSKVGRDGPIAAMGVPRERLPHWDDIQILTAQLATRPLDNGASVDTRLVLGPNAKKPLELKIPIIVSDMSFGALSQEAKTALAQGAELAGTAIFSGEGGMLPEAQAACSRYGYELASAKFGWDESIPTKVQTFHFKGGQAAKTGTGGHLPGAKVSEKIAAVRHLPVGKDAISPSAFADLRTPTDFKAFADHVRELSGGIPVGFKMSAQHIERDIDFALEASADYIILDGRGGGTGAAPLLFRDNISVPTIPALARARRHLDRSGRPDVTLIITGGIRTPADFIKAMCLGADGIAVANSAMQAIGCIAARICHTNNCPTGITTQKLELRNRLKIGVASKRLERFLTASTELMQVMARACGHARLADFDLDDLVTFKKEMAELSGVAYAGVTDR